MFAKYCVRSLLVRLVMISILSLCVMGCASKSEQLDPVKVTTILENHRAVLQKILLDINELKNAKNNPAPKSATSVKPK